MSVSVLPELLPPALDMAMAGETGVCHLVNPGILSAADRASLHSELLDPALEPTGFVLPLAQAAVVPASRLAALHPQLRPAAEAIRHHVRPVSRPTSSNSSAAT